MSHVFQEQEQADVLVHLRLVQIATLQHSVPTKVTIRIRQPFI